jgi:hypothetical protein
MSLPRHAAASCQAQLGRGGVATCPRTSDMNHSPQLFGVVLGPRGAGSPRPPTGRAALPRCGICPVAVSNAPWRPCVPAHMGSRGALRVPERAGTARCGDRRGRGATAAAAKPPAGEPTLNCAITVGDLAARRKNPWRENLQLDKLWCRASPWAACQRPTRRLGRPCPGWGRSSSTSGATRAACG